MEFEDILLNRQGGVATITINRPQVHSAFRADTIDELTAAFSDVDAGPEIGVVPQSSEGGVR
jgi:1,4-dihydroxy-2-naphthoyl-CoA synthase